MKRNSVELLAPAGDLEKAYFALEYGADAIFLGAKAYSLRAHASNFEIKDIKEIVDYAHSINKKVYIVTNIICHNSLLKSANDFIDKLVSIQPDGFITADPFLIKMLNEKKQVIHVSTQQSICNSKSAMFWKRNGATRVVLAREVSFDEMELLIKNLKNQIEVEVFIHGAVCISYSGRCMMSNNFSLRDANIGGCAQSCRWVYEVKNPEIKNKSKFFTMSAKDMIQIEYIDKLLEIGVASFKIEGRMKSLHYIATVVKAYRQYIDKHQQYQISYNELLNAANRPVDTAFMDGDANYDKMLYHDEIKKLRQNFVFIINKKIDDYTYEILVKNHFKIDDNFEILRQNDKNINIKIEKMWDCEKQELFSCITPMQVVIIKTNCNELYKKNIGRIKCIV